MPFCMINLQNPFVGGKEGSNTFNAKVSIRNIYIN